MIYSVTIPFNFDTSPIEDMIAESGRGEALKIIERVVLEGLRKVLPSRTVYSYNKSGVDDEIDWNRYVERYTDKWFASHAQEIVDEAAVILAMRASRKKSWREVLTELQEERALVAEDEGDDIG